MSLLLTGFVALVVVAGLLLPLPANRLFGSIGDMFHAPMFAGIFVLVYWLARVWFPIDTAEPAPVQRVVIRSVAIAGILFAFGLFMEFVQSRTGRTASWHDALANGLGLVTGVCLVLANHLRRLSATNRRLPKLLWATAGFMIAIAWWEPIGVIRDVRQMKTDFPLLASFENKVELGRWFFNRTTGRLSDQDATLGDRSLEIVFSVAPHPAMTMTDLRHDWSMLRTIEVDVTLDDDHPEATATIYLNVIDAGTAPDYHDIFRKGFVIRRGVTEHLVVTRADLDEPIDGRRLDLSDVRLFEFQMLDPPTPTTVRVDFLRLK